MCTLSWVKWTARYLTPEDIRQLQELASDNHMFDYYWTYDCVKAYQLFIKHSDKIFWWIMVVRTLRYANEFYRMKVG